MLTLGFGQLLAGAGGALLALRPERGRRATDLSKDALAKAFAAQAKMSGFKGTVASKPFTDVTGNRAYMVAQVTFGGTMAGKPVSTAFAARR